MHEDLLKLINLAVPTANAQMVKGEAGDASILIAPKSLRAVCLFLRDEPTFEFNVLQVISACDFLEENIIEVNYILASFINNLELILKVKLPREKAEVDSVVDIWSAANFQERECFDMLGIQFLGHPDHRRILCPEDWEGFPLRKDYVAAKVYRGMEINPIEKMNIADREFAQKQKNV